TNSSWHGISAPLDAHAWRRIYIHLRLRKRRGYDSSPRHYRRWCEQRLTLQRPRLASKHQADGLGELWNLPCNMRLVPLAEHDSSNQGWKIVPLPVGLRERQLRQAD